MEPKSGVILFLGGPCVGKSALGKAMSASKSRAAYVSVDHDLRRGTDDCEEGPPADRSSRRKRAQELLEEACRQCRHHRVLLLDFVRDLEDAFTLMETLRKHNLPLLQVLYIPHDITCALPPPDPTTTAPSPSTPSCPSSSPGTSSRPTTAEQHQRAAWDMHASLLLEFFSSTTLLTEVTLANPTDGSRRQQQPSSLAQLGYAAATPAWLDRAGWTPGGHWQHPAARLRLRLQPIEPLTSRRLVTDRSERDRVLRAAQAATGLSGLHLPVPSGCVRTNGDARWVAWPGRYVVSHKADGVRHLLFVTEAGATYLINRAGTLYAYPVVHSSSGSSGSSCSPLPVPSGASPGTSSRAPAHAPAGPLPEQSQAQPTLPSQQQAGRSTATTTAATTTAATNTAASATAVPQPQLPPGTVLDGELVFIGGRAFFLAFDALSVRSQRAWHLPLDSRLALLTSLGLESSDDSPTLRRPAAAQAGPVGPTGPVGAPTAGAAAAAAVAAAVHTAGCVLSKKQQAPPLGSDTVRLLRKPHYEVTAAVLALMQRAQQQQQQQQQAAITSSAAAAPSVLHPASLPYPTSGLVFTPRAAMYVLGHQELLLKWQPQQAVSIDVRGRDILQTRAVPITTTPPTTSGSLPVQPTSSLSAAAAAARRKHSSSRPRSFSGLPQLPSIAPSSSSSPSSSPIISSSSTASSSSSSSSSSSISTSSAGGGSLPLPGLPTSSSPQVVCRLSPLLPSCLVYECLPIMAKEWCPACPQVVWRLSPLLPSCLVYECLPIMAKEWCPVCPQVVWRLSPLLPSCLVYQCLPIMAKEWCPVSIRFDKPPGSSSGSRHAAEVEDAMRHPAPWLTHITALVAARQQEAAAYLRRSSLAPAAAPPTPPWRVSAGIISHNTTTSHQPQPAMPATARPAASGGYGGAAGDPAQLAATPQPAAVPPPATPPPATPPPSLPSPPPPSPLAWSSGIHPARRMCFEEVYALASKAVRAGMVGQWVDPATGLESYYSCCLPPAVAAAAAPASGVAAPASGVAAPASVVAAPEDVCRGLVLHPPSRTVVATAFAPFDQWPVRSSGDSGDSVVVAAAGSSGGASTGASSGSSSGASSGAGSGASGTGSGASSISISRTHSGSGTTSSISPSDPWVRASPKIDGSLVVAFLWQDALHVTTTRTGGMHAPQAQWAAAQLHSRFGATTITTTATTATTTAAPAAMQPGWSYLFEAVQRGDRRVVAYPFEGLLLLDAVSPEGVGLAGYADRAALAARLGVMTVPELEGPLGEVSGRLAAGTDPPVTPPGTRAGAGAGAAAGPGTGPPVCPLGAAAAGAEAGAAAGPGTDSPVTPGAAGAGAGLVAGPLSDEGWPTPPAAPTHEGWVLSTTGPDGGQVRVKLVQYAFRWARRQAGLLLQPLELWQRVRCGGASRAQLLAGLPAHLQSLLGSRLDAMEEAFGQVQRELAAQLQLQRRVEGGGRDVGGSGASGAGGGASAGGSSSDASHCQGSPSGSQGSSQGTDGRPSGSGSGSGGSGSGSGGGGGHGGSSSPSGGGSSGGSNTSKPGESAGVMVGSTNPSSSAAALAATPAFQAALAYVLQQGTAHAPSMYYQHSHPHHPQPTAAPAAAAAPAVTHDHHNHPAAPAAAASASNLDQPHPAAAPTAAAAAAGTSTRGPAPLLRGLILTCLRPEPTPPQQQPDGGGGSSSGSSSGSGSGSGQQACRSKGNWWEVQGNSPLQPRGLPAAPPSATATAALMLSLTSSAGVVGSQQAQMSPSHLASSAAGVGGSRQAQVQMLLEGVLGRLDAVSLARAALVCVDWWRVVAGSEHLQGLVKEGKAAHKLPARVGEEQERVGQGAREAWPLVQQEEEGVEGGEGEAEFLGRQFFLLEPLTLVDAGTGKVVQG